MSDELFRGCAVRSARTEGMLGVGAYLILGIGLVHNTVSGSGRHA
ncbi:hypothetical protein [Streptomyces melanosporofaciens]|nr:hypothetical protein [Streptomyces melanosporofaciens]